MEILRIIPLRDTDASHTIFPIRRGGLRPSICKKTHKILGIVTFRSYEARVILMDDVHAACVDDGGIPVFPFTASCTQVPLP